MLFFSSKCPKGQHLVVTPSGNTLGIDFLCVCSRVLCQGMHSFLAQCPTRDLSLGWYQFLPRGSSVALIRFQHRFYSEGNGGIFWKSRQLKIKGWPGWERVVIKAHLTAEEVLLLVWARLAGTGWWCSSGRSICLPFPSTEEELIGRKAGRNTRDVKYFFSNMFSLRCCF